MNQAETNHQLPVGAQGPTGDFHLEKITAIISAYVAKHTAIELKALERKFSKTMVFNAIKTGCIQATDTSLGRLVVVSRARRTKGETIVRSIIKSLLEQELLKSGGSIFKRNNTTTHGLLNDQAVWITAHAVKHLERAKIVSNRHVKYKRKAGLWLVVLEPPTQTSKPPQQTRWFVLRSTPGGYHDLEAL
jgi:hypothetical protein